MKIMIDIKLRDACGRDLIVDFFSRFEVKIRNSSSLRFFGCDETILEFSGRSKVIVSERTQKGYQIGPAHSLT
jgi:hypothetical protein